MPSSVAKHHTKTFGTTNANPGPRFYNDVRNKLWVFTRSRTLNPLEKLLYGGSSARLWVSTLLRTDDRRTYLGYFLNGLRDGLDVYKRQQLQNREAAMRVLRARLLAHQQEQIDAENAAHRASQVRTMDRSERIRTYNFPENRIADHRTGYKAYNLDAVLNGDLEPVVQSAIEMDEAHRLAQVGQEQK